MSVNRKLPKDDEEIHWRKVTVAEGNLRKVRQMIDRRIGK
uniref:Uncharacterized protein n=1 Tax=viral metagenome TaxID=1070528 RepID=A0A6M3LR05_9ZZZZ